MVGSIEGDIHVIRFKAQGLGLTTNDDPGGSEAGRRAGPEACRREASVPREPHIA